MFPFYPFAWWLSDVNQTDCHKWYPPSKEELTRYQDSAIHDLDRKSEEGLLWASKASETGNSCHRFLKEALDLSKYSVPVTNRKTKSTRNAKKPLTELQAMPFTSLHISLPPLPDDGKSNDTWILASELSAKKGMPQTDSLRSDRARDESEKAQEANGTGLLKKRTRAHSSA